MSLPLLTWAFAQELDSPTEKFVLVALCNVANHHTNQCNPRVETLAKETSLGESTVRKALTALVNKQLIARQRPKRSDGTLGVYQYSFPHLMLAENTPPLPDSASPPLPDSAQEPYLDLEPKTLAAAPRVSRNHPMWDPLWDTLTQGFGPATSKDAQGRRAKAVKTLIEVGATPDEVLSRGKRWRRHFPGATLTQEALVKWWDTLPRKELR